MARAALSGLPHNSSSAAVMTPLAGSEPRLYHILQDEISTTIICTMERVYYTSRFLYPHSLRPFLSEPSFASRDGGGRQEPQAPPAVPMAIRAASISPTSRTAQHSVDLGSGRQNRQQMNPKEVVYHTQQYLRTSGRERDFSENQNNYFVCG